MTDVLEDAKSHAELRPALPCEASSITEERRQIHELTTAIAARDSFLAQIGHELRNSVAPMLLVAEQLSALAQDPEVGTKLVSRTAILTRHLNKFIATIDRVAQVADLRRGKLELAPDSIDLVEVVEEVCRDMQREAEAGGVMLVITAPGPVTGTWDRSRVKQIVANLVSNAIRYGGNGQVAIRVTDRVGDVELVIEDHGPGIDPVALPRLFDRFDHERSRRTGGFGIGLWVVNILCTAMGGSVTADNRTSGGARFCVVLPRG